MSQARVLLHVLSGMLWVCTLTSAPIARADIQDGAPAIDLLGQYDQTDIVNPVPSYTRGARGDAPNRLGFDKVLGLAIDGVNHRLFVSDSGNHRVLVYELDSGNQLVDRIPDFVLGQSDFATNASGLSAAALNNPRGLAYDDVGGRLFVVDSNNHRVLVFDVASITSGESAVAVLGQPDFTSNVGATSRNRLNVPISLAYDSAGQRLFVGEVFGNRVTVFDVASIMNGEDAANVLGQPNFTSSTTNVTAEGTSNPRDLVYDAANSRLFVAHSSASRVVIYDVATIADGEAAINVLGQANFTSSGLAITQAGMASPSGLAYDPDAALLYVSDSGSSSTSANRVTVYDVASVSDGEDAVAVLGQPDFTSGAAATTQAGLDIGSTFVGSMVFDGVNKRLFVSQPNVNRISVFDVDSIVNGENAVDLLGQFTGDANDLQPLYTKSGANNTPNQYGMNSPSDVVVDAVHHRLFVADGSNHRVLVYQLTPENTFVDRLPDFVLGQPDFVSAASNVSQAGLISPAGLVYDPVQDRLFVSQTSGARVSVFDVASITNGENAVNVLGQPDFVSSTSALTQAGMCNPRALAYDSSTERLFVADSCQRRVLVFDVESITDGENAVNVLGQPDFTSGAPALTASGMSFPAGATIDVASRRLFVADTTYNRVQVFDITSISDGEAAVNVIGQADLTTSTGAVSQEGLQGPRGLEHVPGADLLFVSNSNRVTVYDVSEVTNGEPAINVLGQPDFTSSASAATQSSLSSPGGVTVDSSALRLYVSDTSNHRLMVFETGSQLNYSTTTFVESGADDGSIVTTATLTLVNEQFAVSSGAMTQGVHFNASNVPAGLSVVVTGTSATTAKVSLAGNAVANDNLNDVANFTIDFLDAAFVVHPAEEVDGSSRSDLAIDFIGGPTPTPTPTVTGTSTPTPTTTPGAVPTAVPTPTGVVTTGPTPGATATPLPGDNELRGTIVNAEGTPVAGVVVYLTGGAAETAAGGTRSRMFSSITNAQGQFFFENIPAGTYVVEPNYTGLAFVPSQVTLGTGSIAPTIVASPTILGTEQCNRRDFGVAIEASDDVSLALLEFALRRAELFLEQVAERPGRRAAALRASLSSARNNLLQSYNRLIMISRRLPKVRFDCRGIAGCERQTLRREASRYVAEIDNLRRLSLFVFRRVTEGTGRNVGNVHGVRARRLHRNARQAAEDLPRQTFRCERPV